MNFHPLMKSKRCDIWWKRGLFLVLLGAPVLAADTPLKVERVATGFNKPLFVCAPPGDTKRIFVVEQTTSKILIFDLAAKKIVATPFITVPGVVSGGEQGLLGLAFHPDYAHNGYFYVNYTAAGGGPAGHTEVTRFTATGDPATAGTANPATKTVILKFDQPEANHNGGWLGFGKDNFLYISAGDGGGGNDIHGTIGNGQTRTTLLGKLLRIDVDNGVPYAIPEGNPFKGHATYKQEIWAFGLRNPWRCSFDPLTGDLWIGDVGQNTREEIDFLPAGQGGLNFGWRPREGKIQTPGLPGGAEQTVTPAVEPLFDYTHSLGVSVTGGYIYRGKNIPGFQGTYIFADYGTARFWTLTYDGKIATATDRTSEINPGAGAARPIGQVSSFGVDGAGEIYICDYSDGEIYRLLSNLPPLKISDPALVESKFSFSFNATAGNAYVVEAKKSLDQESWDNFLDVPAPASNTPIVVTSSLSQTQQFFRIRGE